MFGLFGCEGGQLPIRKRCGACSCQRRGNRIEIDASGIGPPCSPAASQHSRRVALTTARIGRPGRTGRQSGQNILPAVSETRDAAIYIHERIQPLLRLAHQPCVSRVTFNFQTRLSGATGMEKKNVEPCPRTDSAQIRPPERSTIRLQVASPMPLPLIFVPWRRLKGSKMADACTASNPCPFSATEIRQSFSSLVTSIRM